MANSPSTKDISNPSEQGSLDWRPSTALSEFPNANSPNTSSAEATIFSSTHKWSLLSLTQPGKVVSLGYITDYSPPFLVLPETARSLIEEQRAEAREQGQGETRNTWKLAVGLAVGLGVPLLMAASGLIGYRLGNGAWRDRRNLSPPAKNGPEVN